MYHSPAGSKELQTPIRKQPTILLLASGKKIVTSSPDAIITLDDSNDSIESSKRKGKLLKMNEKY